MRRRRVAAGTEPWVATAAQASTVAITSRASSAASKCGWRLSRAAASPAAASHSHMPRWRMSAPETTMSAVRMPSCDAAFWLEADAAKPYQSPSAPNNFWPRHQTAGLLSGAAAAERGRVIGANTTTTNQSSSIATVAANILSSSPSEAGTPVNSACDNAEVASTKQLGTVGPAAPARTASSPNRDGGVTRVGSAAAAWAAARQPSANSPMSTSVSGTPP